MFAHPFWVIGVNTMFSVRFYLFAVYHFFNVRGKTDGEQILWFAAFVSVASYTNGGISDGEKKEKDEKVKKEGGCALFPAGTGEDPKACKMNQAAVGLGVIMWYTSLPRPTRHSFPGSIFFSNHLNVGFSGLELLQSQAMPLGISTNIASPHSKISPRQAMILKKPPRMLLALTTNMLSLIKTGMKTTVTVDSPPPTTDVAEV